MQSEKQIPIIKYMYTEWHQNKEKNKGYHEKLKRRHNISGQAQEMALQAEKSEWYPSERH